MEQKVNLYTIKLLDNICEQLDNRAEEPDIYINTKEAFGLKSEKRRKSNSPKKPLTKSTDNNKVPYFTNEKKNGQNYPDTNVHPYVHENVIRLQRAFKKYYMNKKSLPENFFFTQKILKYQFEKRNKNYEDNFRILFPLSDKSEQLDFNNSIDTIKTSKNKINSNENLLASNLIHSPYEDGKIHLFAKILDIDIIVIKNFFRNNL